jgi:hypothetical protein
MDPTAFVAQDDNREFAIFTINADFPHIKSRISRGFKHREGATELLEQRKEKDRLLSIMTDEVRLALVPLFSKYPKHGDISQFDLRRAIFEEIEGQEIADENAWKNR